MYRDMGNGYIFAASPAMPSGGPISGNHACCRVPRFNPLERNRPSGCLVVAAHVQQDARHKLRLEMEASDIGIRTRG
jgi:hypothetical protein